MRGADLSPLLFFEEGGLPDSLDDSPPFRFLELLMGTSTLVLLNDDDDDVAGDEMDVGL